MTHDHFAYVGAYRKALDEISQYKKGLWDIVLDSRQIILQELGIQGIA